MIATDIQALNLYLDENPDDVVARMALADAYLEAGEEAGLGIRALAVNGKRPVQYYHCYETDQCYGMWFFHTQGGRVKDRDYMDYIRQCNMIPTAWGRRIEPESWIEDEGRYQLGSNGTWIGYSKVRSEVELLVARAFLKLPVEVQNRILEGDLDGMV